MNLTVIIATYGSLDWLALAVKRALPSAKAQTDNVLHVHLQAGTLAEARNQGALLAETDWLVFLDGDDELAPGYLEAIDRSILAHSFGNRDRLYVPRVAYVGAGRRETPPTFPREEAPERGNWLVIGTAVPADLFHAVGGFEEWTIWEDWALFARMQKAGAPVVRVPDAIYKAHRRPSGHALGVSRNHALGRAEKDAEYDRIRRAVFPELYGEDPS